MAIAKVVVAVDKIYTTCSPRPAIMVLGTVTSGTPVYGSLVGLRVNAGTTVVVAGQGSVIVTAASTTATVTGAPVV